MDITPILKSIQKDLLSTARSIYIRKDSVASGNTLKSLKVLMRSGKVSQASLTLVGHEKVYYTLYGRGKGKQPPFSALEKWFKARGIPYTSRDVRSLQVRIGEKGTKKRYWGFYEELDAQLLPIIQKKLADKQTGLIFTADILNSFRL